MSDFVLLLTWLLPLLSLLFVGQGIGRWIIVIAPLPALVAAITLPLGTSISLPWLLLGVELGMDETGQVFLLFSGLLWLVASLVMATSKTNEQDSKRYRSFFLIAMAGNLGLIVAEDMISFYLGFTLMGLATYGLIKQHASQRARQAARRYLAWTLVGEMLLFAAIVSLAFQHNAIVLFSALSTPSDYVVLLLILGFGIKLALPGLHFWLPQAYAVAPTSAVIVLSGAMINAGLLGWLRFLPADEVTLPGWGQVLMIVGITGIFFGLVVGLLQNRPRLILGYSSISKMGVLTSGMGAALMWPQASQLIVTALVIYAAHHALVKGALFMGLGLVERGEMRPWMFTGLVILALALAGAPLTSGAFAKSIFAEALPPQADYLLTLLGISSLLVSLLMVRLLFLVWQQAQTAELKANKGLIATWLLLIAVIATYPLIMADAAQLLTGYTPLILALVTVAAVLFISKRFRQSRLNQMISCLGKTMVKKTYGRTRLVTLSKCAVKKPVQLVQTMSEKLPLVYSELLQRMQQLRWIRSRQSTGASDKVDNWSLSGSLWLGILVLLLLVLLINEIGMMTGGAG
jgi:formate hydrogenlyase subunit 3/multisubunit Na+/H+ antiporter MnhD subunit